SDRSKGLVPLVVGIGLRPLTRRLGEQVGVDAVTLDPAPHEPAGGSSHEPAPADVVQGEAHQGGADALAVALGGHDGRPEAADGSSPEQRPPTPSSPSSAT